MLGPDAVPLLSPPQLCRSHVRPECAPFSWELRRSRLLLENHVPCRRRAGLPDVGSPHGYVAALPAVGARERTGPGVPGPQLCQALERPP